MRIYICFQISFAIMEVDDWSLFYIEGDSTIVSDTIFDFETSKRFYTVSVRAVDEDGAFAVKSFVFEVMMGIDYTQLYGTVLLTLIYEFILIKQYIKIF